MLARAQIPFLLLVGDGNQRGEIRADVGTVAERLGIRLAAGTEKNILSLGQVDFYRFVISYDWVLH